MTNNLVDAMKILHQRNECLRKKGANVRELEANDLALDELVNNPDRIGNPVLLARYALKNAYQKLGGRDKYHVQNPEEDFTESLARDAGCCCTDEYDYRIIEINDLIERSNLKKRDREIIGYLQEGMNVAEIAELYNIPKKRAAVQVSRTRHRALSEWDKASNG
jgi:hypothetical protein